MKISTLTPDQARDDRARRLKFAHAEVLRLRAELECAEEYLVELHNAPLPAMGITEP